MKKIAIQLKNIKKTYSILYQRPTLIEKIFKRNKETFAALKGIDLTVYEGEKVAIFGANGSGKTTLLKIMSGIANPDSGEVIVQGKAVSLIDLESGFHPDLTGRENIFLNGMVVGMSKNQIEKNLKKIIKFANIGKFIDAPLYTYSSGMKLRLGFSIAIHANPKILILDEGMSVGDKAFQEKSYKYIMSKLKSKLTIIVVSHWLESLEKVCHTYVWMDKGTIRKSGPIGVMEDYKNS